MKKIVTILIMLLSCFAYAANSIVVGNKNFSEKNVQIAIILLESDMPDGSRLCVNVEKIYPKILEQRVSNNGKMYSKEKWYLSGCEGANVVIAKLYPSGLVGIEEAEH